MENKPRKFGRCCYCDTPLNRHNFSREHVLPKSRNGSNKKANKLPCCITCNQEKSNMTVDEYIRYLDIIKPHNYQFKILMATKILSI